MSSVNSVHLMGRLGKDPTIKSVGANNTPVCNFSIAISDKRGGKEETTWIDIVVWEKTAENCAKYLHKGDGVYVQGRIQVREWEKDGQKRKAWEVVAERVTFLPRPKGDLPVKTGEDHAAAAAADKTLDEIPF